MSTPPGPAGNRIPRDLPPPLTVAASLAAIEGLGLLAYAVLEVAATTSSRLAVGLTTSFFFAAYGAVLIGCAWALTRGRSWSRSPVVLAQLIQLGVAWSFRGGDTTLIAVALGLVALIVIAGLLHPASIAHLTEEEPA
ncbi:hypothetical protein [Nocardioides donggukensis]|uniref:Integral membrane protein n=1 Tax=Nocardioides donggukensis TaxID=2774019 RepID=A0A927PZG5_9ACTN|nr:hypothetical protein [Nocardioides donggukensis]MBD8870133.1 hypothetical protein [Nocardioides donggukensis]